MTMSPENTLAHPVRKGILIKLIEFLQPLFPKDTYILFDCLNEKAVECIDTYSLFQYMREQKMRVYYCILEENPKYAEIKNDEGIVALAKERKFMRKNFWRLLRARYVITSFGDLPKRVTEFLWRNKYITYLFAEHGVMFMKTFPLTTGYLSAKKYNQMIVSNDEEADLFVRFGWQRENLVKLGLPRWDLLKRKPHEQKTVFVMFTWRLSFQVHFNHTIEQHEYWKGILSFLRNPELQKILEESNTKIRLAFHHAILHYYPEILRIISSLHSIEVIDSCNLSQQIGKTDLFITDYSSIAFDFMFLDIPVIFYRPDFNDTTLVPLDREDMDNARRMDAKLYNCFYDVDEVIAKIKYYIDNGFVLEPENKKKTDSFYYVRKDIRKKLVELLEENKK